MKNATHLTALIGAMTASIVPGMAMAKDTAGAASMYKATYNPKTDRYCIRSLRDDATGEVRVGARGPDCRTKLMWERAGLTINHQPEARMQLAQH